MPSPNVCYGGHGPLTPKLHTLIPECSDPMQIVAFCLIFQTARLIYCYLYKANCSLFKEAIPVNKLSAVVLPNAPMNR